MVEGHFRSVMGCFVTGVTVISVGGEWVHGMTANAFTSVSLEPPMVLACVADTARMNRCIEQQGSFGVSVLSQEQHSTARLFARPAREHGLPQFDEVGWHPGPVTGAPLIDSALAWLECDVVQAYPGGDHVIYVGRVLGCVIGAPGAPLTFWNGRLGAGAPAEGTLSH